MRIGEELFAFGLFGVGMGPVDLHLLYGQPRAGAGETHRQRSTRGQGRRTAASALRSGPGNLILGCFALGSERLGSICTIHFCLAMFWNVGHHFFLVGIKLGSDLLKFHICSLLNLIFFLHFYG